MNLPLKPSISTLGLLAASLLPALAADPSADELLKQMSAKLAASKSFAFEATRELDAGLVARQELPMKAKITAAVQRPNRFAGQAVGKAGTRRFVFDGNTLSLLDVKTNTYAAVPMRTTIDGLVDQLDTKFGFVPPLAEFAVSSPYKELRQQSMTMTYLGRGKTSAGFLGWFGVECHRIWLAGKEADAELWIGVNDQLPHKLTATFHREGKPQLRIAFTKWNLAAPVNPAEFTFTPPKGSEKIEMWTTAKMQSNAKNR